MVSADIERKMKFGTPEQVKNITTHFGAADLVGIRTEDVTSFIGDIFSGSVQNGLRTLFCDTIADLLWFDNYMNIIGEWNSKHIHSNLTEYTMAYYSNVTIDVNRADRSWNWLTCNEFGYFQGPDNV